tara:strand:- start:62 stop:382 length:321 start_codon:yes stop_codon:yes gene_type:complete
MTSIRRFFKRLIRSLGIRFSSPYKTVRAENLPTNLKNKVIYIEGDWTAAFKCPCGCNDVIELNLIDDVRPVWVIKDTKKITISPSVWKKDGCKSHFFVRKGLIEWC